MTESRKVLMNSFVLSNLNDYPPVWMLTNTKSVNIVEAIQKKPYGLC